MSCVLEYGLCVTQRLVHNMNMDMEPRTPGVHVGEVGIHFHSQFPAKKQF